MCARSGIIIHKTRVPTGFEGDATVSIFIHRADSMSLMALHPVFKLLLPESSHTKSK